MHRGGEDVAGRSPAGRRAGTWAGALTAALALVLSSCTGVPSPTGGQTTLPSPTVPGTSGPAPSPTTTPVMPATSQKVVLGDPWSSDPERVHAVAASALKIIDGTRKGQRITLSMFNMTYPTAADTLIRAHRRGVDVHVVVNSENARSKQVRKLRSALGTRTKARSWVVVRGGGMRMHSKFLLASSIGGEPEVVWVSSGNLTNANGRNQANEAIITTGDALLYAFVATQFDLMRRGVTDPERLARTATTRTAAVQTFPLPRGGPGNDPVEALLDDVTCIHGADRTIVRLAHLLLTKERLYLTDRLRELKAEGCDVRIVVHLRGWLRRGRKALVKPGPGRIDLRSAQGTILHTKITTIDGWDSGGNRLEVAMVGTHNLTGRALTTVPQGYNDELSLTIRNPEVMASYNAWVDMVIRKHSKSVS